MLSASLARDTGVKLEVNSKILDSCTGLMAAIQQLIKKSKTLQDEIVGKGKVTIQPYLIITHFSYSD